MKANTNEQYNMWPSNGPHNIIIDSLEPGVDEDSYSINAHNPVPNGAHVTKPHSWPTRKHGHIDLDGIAKAVNLFAFLKTTTIEQKVEILAPYMPIEVSANIDSYNFERIYGPPRPPIIRAMPKPEPEPEPEPAAAIMPKLTGKVHADSNFYWSAMDGYRETVAILDIKQKRTGKYRNKPVPGEEVWSEEFDSPEEATLAKCARRIRINNQKSK